MSDVQNLSAEVRDRAGKGAARQSRRDGRVPGVIYGDKKPPTLISVAPRELMKELRKKAFHVTLFDIAFDGHKERVLPRDVQFDPVSDHPIHVDFMRVDPSHKVRVKVPIKLKGMPLGVKEGGILDFTHREIEVECLPTFIPPFVEVNVGELDQLLEGARRAPLSDPDYEKISTALHALVDALAKPRSTEKSSSALEKRDEPEAQPETAWSARQDPASDGKASGHGRHGVATFKARER